MNTTHKGFSLIEVLVALVLTTVGVLGMVALQGRSVQYVQDSVQRNVAVDLANELVEIIRANPSELFEKSAPKSPINTGIKSQSIFFKSKGGTFSNTADCVATANKQPASAKEQRDCWIARAKNLLPGGAEVFNSDTRVCRSSTVGNCDGKGSVLEIRMAWQVREGSCLDAGDTTNDSPVCTYTLRVQP